MQTFEDWVASCNIPAVKEHSAKLFELGVSHHTFWRPEADLVSDLVAAGVPRLPAADIAHSGKTFFEAQRDRSKLPLAVFWDVENVRIPTGLGGDQIARTIKSKLKPFGHLTLFNAYFEVNGLHMPPEKRSSLQLSGCHIIDTPHINRKEVADKMIIVDALLFALQYKEHGGTLCFITGDTDYAYLLSKLSEFPQFRTVLVSQHGTKDVLHMSAHSFFSWQLDIIGEVVPTTPMSAVRPKSPFRNSPNRARSPSKGQGRRSPQPADQRTKSPGTYKNDSITLTGPGSPAAVAVADTTSVTSDGKQNPPPPVYTTGTPNPTTQPRFPSSCSFSDDAEEDAMMILRHVMFELQAGLNVKPLKSLVGIKLKEKNPIRFGNKENRTALLTKAADPQTGFLVQEGEGGTVTLRLRSDAFQPPEH